MTFLAGAEDLPLREILSGVSSTVSLVGWIVILIPQLLENYLSGSSAGLSLIFCVGWLLGAIFNVAGAIWAHLLPSVIALGFYFCIANCILLLQAVYYRVVAYRAEKMLGEMQPLLVREADLREGRRRRKRRVSVAHSHEEEVEIAKVLGEDGSSGWRSLLVPFASILGICVVGTVGWYFAWRGGAWSPTPPENPGNGEGGPAGAMLLGYISAGIYLFARLPQIWQNWRGRSTEGLSLLFFMISTLANLTYGGGILFHSTDRQYILDNLPWLLGSIGVCSEDLVLFIQFYMYRGNSKHRRRRALSVSIPPTLS